MIPAYGEVAQKLTEHLQNVEAENRGTYIALIIDGEYIGSISRDYNADWYFTIWDHSRYLYASDLQNINRTIKYAKKLDSRN